MDPNTQEDEMTTDENVVAVPTSSPDVTDGVSSSDTDESGKDGMIDAVRDEFLKTYGETEEESEGDELPDGDDVEEQSATEETPEDAEEPDSTQSDSADDDEDYHLSDKEFKGLPENARKRMGYLNQKKRDAEKRVSEYEVEVESLKDKSERFDILQNFAQENNILPENISKAYQMMADLSTGNYQKFLDDIAPFYQMASQAVGKSVPDDLQAQIDDGMMTPEAAAEISRSRIAAQDAQAKAERAEQRIASQQAEQQKTSNLEQIVSAVNAREAEIRRSDPDYARKAADVHAELKNLVSSLKLNIETKEAGVELVNLAYDRVNSRNAAKPKPVPDPTPPRVSSTSTQQGRTQPQSILGIITQASEEYRPAK